MILSLPRLGRGPGQALVVSRDSKTTKPGCGHTIQNKQAGILFWPKEMLAAKGTPVGFDSRRFRSGTPVFNEGVFL
jgi:hypothetical protein